MRNAAQQQNGFGEHQLGHAASIGERRVEDGNAALLSRLQIHLVGADAEAAHADQPRGVCENGIGQLRGRADANEIRIANRLQELVFRKRFRMAFEVRVALAPEGFDSRSDERPRAAEF